MVVPNLPGLIGSLFSVIPTMLVMYLLLRRFDRFFEERRLLFALLFGLLSGAAVTLIEVITIAFERPDLIRAAESLVIALAVIALAYPILETLGKLVVVNWHTYRGRRDTPYYAVGIGLGFAAINVFIIAGRGVGFFLAPEAGFTHGEIALHLALLLVLFTGGIMTHGFSTVIMGQAIAERDILRAFFLGALLLMPYYAGYWGLYALTTVTPIGFLFPVAAFLYGLFGVRYVVRNTLENVVPIKERRRLLREMQKADREAKDARESDSADQE